MLESSNHKPILSLLNAFLISVSLWAIYHHTCA